MTAVVIRCCGGCHVTKIPGWWSEMYELTESVNLFGGILGWCELCCDNEARWKDTYVVKEEEDEEVSVLVTGDSVRSSPGFGDLLPGHPGQGLEVVPG